MPAIKGLGFGDDSFSQCSGLGSIKQKGQVGDPQIGLRGYTFGSRDRFQNVESSLCTPTHGFQTVSGSLL